MKGCKCVAGPVMATQKLLFQGLLPLTHGGELVRQLREQIRHFSLAFGLAFFRSSLLLRGVESYLILISPTSHAIQALRARGSGVEPGPRKLRQAVMQGRKPPRRRFQERCIEQSSASVRRLWCLAKGPGATQEAGSSLQPSSSGTIRARGGKEQVDGQWPAKGAANCQRAPG